MPFKKLRLLSILLILSVALVTNAFGLTADQLQLLQQLSPEERQALIKQFDDNPEVVQPQISSPAVVVPSITQTTADIEREKEQSKSIKTTDLEPFGYDLFKGAPTTFAPATDIPIPVDYIIGPGDTIILQFFGKENARYSLVVTREGTVQIPKIGPVSAAGQRFPELQKKWQNYINEKMIGVRASITMGPLRSIRIFVLGEANRPGSYTVSALSTMTNALFVSGGIKYIGSLRNIQLKRGGKLVTEMDLYDLLLKGDTSRDVRLQPGDVIFVPPIGRTVGIAGAARRPAIYELKNERTVADLIRISGGLRPTAVTEGAQLKRISPSGDRIVIDVNLSDTGGRSFALADGDVLQVRSVLDRVEEAVKLSGHVERPGTYQWRKGMRLTDLIASVDDLKPRPELNYVLVKRELPPDRRIQVYSANIGLAFQNRQSSENILLKSRDEVMVFDLTSNRSELIQSIIVQLRNQARSDDPEKVVAVGGQVVFPGEYPLEEGMRVSDLLRASGSLKQQAYSLEAELIRYQIIENRVRETSRLPLDLAAIIKGEAQEDRVLRPFDSINIKQLSEWRDRQSVEIRGEVAFPGQYVVERGETLNELIERVGGFTDQAFFPGAVLVREELRAKEQEQLDRLRDRLKGDLAAISLQQMQEDSQKQEALVMAQGLVNQLESTKAVGRLVMDLEGIINGVRTDIVLQDSDRIFIPDKPQEVTVLGEVNYPTSHIFDEKLSRDDYINHSGGTTYKADKDRVYVIKANGQVMSPKANSWFGSNPQDIQVGDTIVVPLDADRIRPLHLWTSVAQIVYQTALAVAAFNSLGAF